MIARSGAMREALAAGRIERVLLRAPNWLGDAVLAWPVLQAFKRRHPEVRVDVAARPRVAGLYTAALGADAVLAWPSRSRLGNFITTFESVRGGRYQLAILLPNSFESALVPWLARVPHRLGTAGNGRGFMLTETVPRASAKHQRAAYLELLAPLAFEATAADGLVTLKDAPALSLMKPPYAVLAPGAAYGGAKRWTVAGYATLAADLAKRLAVAVVGTAAEAELCAAVVSGARAQGATAASVTSLAGRTSLVELVHLLAAARLVYANDSGPMHLAAALGVATVGIFGATDAAATGPIGPRAVVVRHEVSCSPCGLRECNQSAHHCMMGLEAKDVLRAGLALAGMGERA